MAKAEWIKATPSSGSGNAEVQVSSTAPHTGRLARQSVLTWKAANVSNVERTVKQAGLREVLSASDGVLITADGETLNVLK